VTWETPTEYQRRPKTRLRTLVLCGATIATFTFVAAGCGSTGTASQATGTSSANGMFPTVRPASGTAIPKVTVSFGMRPVANDVMFVIATKQGWFKDVGINIAPGQYGNQSTFDNAVPLLLNSQLNVEALDPIPTISTLGSEQSIRFIGLSDIFLGYQILAAPSTHAKTVSQFMQQGLPFRQAMAKALDQLKGQTFTIPPIVSDRGFLDTAFNAGGLSLFKTAHVVVTPDSNALNLASGGRTKFASFDGAPFTAQLLGAGWIPIVTPLDLSKNLPPGVDSPAELLVEPPGIASTQQWASQNAATVLRFDSVMFRLINAINSAPSTVLQYELGYLNAFAGTHLTLPELQSNILHLDPLISFQEQAPYFNDAKSALYYKNWYAATLNYDVKQGAVPKGTYSADNLIWAGQVYKQLAKFKNMTDTLLTKGASMHLDSNQQVLMAKARQYYAWFDFLDSYRYAHAAVS
jgi:ABC-type nitrate/sulfonate/bicarbonate transport system substrate-binding protein